MCMRRDTSLQTFKSGFSSHLSSRAEGRLGLDLKALVTTFRNFHLKSLSLAILLASPASPLGRSIVPQGGSGPLGLGTQMDSARLPASPQSAASRVSVMSSRTNLTLALEFSSGRLNAFPA